MDMEEEKITDRTKEGLAKASGFDESRAVAVCVGIEDYIHLPKLPGAAKSANRVFDALTKSEIALYRSGKSRLLLNPTYGEFHRFLESYTYFLNPEDHLLFYFCGRTDFVNGKSVLCLKDSVHLPVGDINPFTVQGWQAFFQLAGVAHTQSSVLFWDAYSAVENTSSAPLFMRALRDSCRNGLPLPKDIPCGIQAVFHPLTKPKGPASQKPTHFAKAITSTFKHPPRHTVANPFLSFPVMERAIKRELKKSGTHKYWSMLNKVSTLPLCRNPQAKIRAERFISSYVDMLRCFADLPAGEYSTRELLEGISPAAWTVINKLSYEPWGLITDGTKKGYKKITRRGRGFLKGSVSIPLIIHRIGKKWHPYEREMVDIRYFKRIKKQRKKELEELSRQLELFP